MDGAGERTNFEVCVVVSKRRDEEKVARKDDCVELLVTELGKIGIVAERVDGVSNEFIKLAAYAEAIGRTATELKFKKLTYAGVNLPFDWEDAEAFVRQPDGMLFSWTERYQCFNHLIYGIVNSTDASMRLEFGEREFTWQRNDSLLNQMKCEGIVGDIFPLHDEPTRKQLLKKWALNLLDFTWQPIDEIYSYFGMKIATYFTFLGMYTRWMFFPASFGLAVQFINLGSWQFLMLPFFTVFLISWAVLFFQFWKRENSSLLASWGINHPLGVFLEHNISETCSSTRSQTEMEKKLASDKPMEEKQQLLREEWFGHLIRIRNNAISIIGIICLQLPFELAYAHFFEITKYGIIRYGLTAIYLLAIQYYTKMGGKLAAMLIKFEKNEGMQSSADSMVYKVFGLYFMQSYIGLFYHVLLHRSFESLRQILIQRLIVSQVLQHFIENSVPYAMYSCKKFKSAKRKQEKGGLAKLSRVSSRVEKEYLKPSYSASICAELEDGTFDDFLELALQFGMVMMFACAFPLAFCFSLLGNITEIRADALKLLVTMRRPVPRAVPTIGAWLNIFQFLIITSICTNCMLLVCLYDQEGKWSLEPGLAAILVIEHVLLLIKFGLSHFVPEEPAWVKARREQNIGKAQNMCTKQFFRSIRSRQKGEKAH